MRCHETPIAYRSLAGIGLAALMLLLLSHPAAADEPHGLLVQGRKQANGWLVVPATPSAPARKDTPGLRFVTLSGSRFQPTGSALTYSPIDGAVHAMAIPAGAYSFSADFESPTGAIIREVLFYVVDSDADADMALSLQT